MPIYEFYCTPCNTIFNFFSRSVNTTAVPACPRCQARLERRMSLFACIGRASDSDADADLPIDEARLSEAMGRLASAAENLNEDDPRQAAGLMCKFSEMTGVKLGDGMQEALRRMAAGEDPDSIEADMGDILEQEDPFAPGGSPAKRRRATPLRDETLYEL
ncbi:MAG: zinc ribbon domain-containing protein [Deltaproteobacteria bacterium]|nr:zinc ribbon domain-containing protein [Deltaproteobacteria bacterium]